MVKSVNKNSRFIINKLYNTIETYKEIYPELMYLENEIHKSCTDTKKRKHQVAELVLVSNWLKHLTMQYYVFNIIYKHLEKDIASVQQGTFEKNNTRLYLELGRS